MDKNKIFRLISDVLKDFTLKSFNIFIEEDDVIRIEIVSNEFVGMRLIKRLDLLNKIFLEVNINQFVDFHLVFNPLTEQEKKLGISETGEKTSVDLSYKKIALPPDASI